MTARRRAWLGFTCLAAVVCLALLALSWAALRLETTERTRHALWRIDTWMSAWLAAETARPAGRYLDAHEPAIFRPLVTARFETDARGLRGRAIDETLPAWFEGADLRGAVTAAERRLEHSLAGDADTALQERVATCVVPGDGPASAAPESGPVLPFFLVAPPPEVGELLVLARRWVADGDETIQGAVVDWTGLRERLTGLLEPGPGRFRLAPIRDGDEGGDRLATLPVRVRHESPPMALAGLTPVRGALGLGWIVALVALATLGLALRRGLDLAERRERFAVTVTHELRTPLTTLRMYAEMLSSGMVRDPAQRDAYLATLRAEADRLGVLVENVLAHARLEGSAPRAAPATVLLSDLLEGLLPELRHHAEQAGMELTFEGASVTDRKVRADPETLAQVMRNLVDNAAKYAAGIDRHLRLAVEERGGFVGLRLADGGPGIAPRDRERIFRAFERGGTAPAATPGIGLGLGLSRGLVRELGGDLVLEPSSGAGAVFRVDLPVDDRPAR